MFHYTLSLSSNLFLSSKPLKFIHSLCSYVSSIVLLLLVVCFSLEIILGSKGAQGVKLNETDWDEKMVREKFPTFASAFAGQEKTEIDTRRTLKGHSVACSRLSDSGNERKMLPPPPSPPRRFFFSRSNTFRSPHTI